MTQVQPSYIEVRFQAASEQQEILIALLGELPYESFEEGNEELKAYIKSALFQERDLMEDPLLASFNPVWVEIPYQNWNETWEKSFQSLIVKDQLYIRAPFHPPHPSLSTELIIQPKMAFGTGHHATTELMLQWMMQLNLSKKIIADLGCGTAILAIFAEKLGAKIIHALDIDRQAVINAEENILLNNCVNIMLRQGTAEDVQNIKAEVVMANINRNILLDEMHFYAHMLTDGGELLLSGFYSTDQPLILSKAAGFGLESVDYLEKNGWVCAYLKKSVNR